LSANRPFEHYFNPANEVVSGRSLFDYVKTAPEKLTTFLQNCSRSRQMTIGTLKFYGRNKEENSYRCEGALLEPADESNPTIIFLRLQPKEQADIRFSLLTEKINKLNREIRERRRAEERNEKLYQKALQASRLKDEFLATVSHELRTPLNSILGWTQILKTGGADSDTFKKALETIERNTRVQVRLIEDILEVSRIITGKLHLDIQPTEIVAVIEAAVDSVRPMAANKGVKLEISLDPNVGLISADAKRIQQIVWNLISNAIKFTPPEGKVQVRLETLNSHIEITVSDTGIGIPGDFLPYVFERFLQADASKTRRHGGLGLGLSIVRHLTELHGGTVSVQSEGNEMGATFIISLPVLKPDRKEDFDKLDEKFVRPAPELKTKMDHLFSLKDLRLLIVDDESDARELLKLMLEHCRAKVETAASAIEAFEKLKHNKFDVLISDIAMPGEDGYWLITKIRQLPNDLGGRIPAIAVTAHARKKDRKYSLSKGFDFFLAKPFEPDELLTLIVELVRRTDRD
jgi:signal transduction histidine kinase/ActR/RegA family two-component response regulator